MSIRSSWKKAGLNLAFDESEDEAWVNKEFNSDVQGRPLKADGDATAAGAGGADPVEEDEPSLKMTDLLEVLEKDDDDSTGGGEDEGDDSKVEVVA